MNDYLKKEKLWSKNYLLILLANALISMNFFMLNPTFPIYAKGFTENIGIVGLLTGLFTLSAMLIRPLAGRVTDKYDKKQIFIAGVLLLCLSFTGYIVFRSVPGIICSRFAHGFGWGFTTTAIATLASDIIPQSRMGEGIGYFTASSVISMAIGPALGLEVLNRSNAEVVFLLAAAFTLLSGVSLFAYRKSTLTSVGKIDEEETSRKGLSCFFEKTAILPAAVGFFLSIVGSTIMTFLPIYAAERGIINIGYFFVIQSAVILISRPLAGKLIDRRGFGIAIIPALLCTIVSMVTLFIADKPVLFIISALIYGLGFGTTISSLQTMSVVKTDSDRRGAANSTYLFGMDMGFGLGSILAGYIANAVGYSTMYLLCIIPLVTGLAVFVFGRSIVFKKAELESSLHDV